MTKNFNADFYVTCATVIPVLFIAVAVQGQWYQAMLRDIVRGARVGTRRARLVALVLQQAAFFVVMAGFLGELYALNALYSREEFPGARPLVFGATFFLLSFTVLPPLELWINATSRMRRTS